MDTGSKGHLALKAILKDTQAELFLSRFSPAALLWNKDCLQADQMLYWQRKSLLKEETHQMPTPGTNIFHGC